MPERLGELLVQRQTVGAAELEHALRLHRETGQPIGAVLVRLGFIAESELADALAQQLELPRAQKTDFSKPPDVVQNLSQEFLRQARVLPLREQNGTIELAMADPLDDYSVKVIRLATDKAVSRIVAADSEIETAIDRYFAGDSTGTDIAALSVTTDAEDLQRLRDLAAEAPVIQLVNRLISEALRATASDIHIEPYESALVVRYRIDGELREMDTPSTNLAAAVISRVKVIANLDIAERRVPQDGRVKLRVDGREVDFRVSTLPTLHGESVVMRILDKSQVPLDLGGLGFHGSSTKALSRIIDAPHGIVLVTGPTGSGKTTTLYAALSELNSGKRKILTVEDPIEYQLQGINQIQVRPQVGMTFASALRAILRHDPDVIMVGEMRDLETARIAVQAALTGHKVLSTLHTNDAPSSVTRLLDIGIEDYLLTSTVNGIIAQRLVRLLCEHCKVEFQPPEPVMQMLQANVPEAQSMFRADGCESCHGTGYRGRTAIIEVLEMKDSVRESIVRGAQATELRSAAREAGMSSMFQDGLTKVAAGMTTIEEVSRVTEDRST